MATILVADDEAKMRKILLLALMEEGHEILQAQNTGEAVEVINNTSLSLVITDLRMPGGGGMEVLQAVKNTNHYIPVIILTAYGTIENAVEALKNGAHDYLLKPCDLEEVKYSVRRALQIQHLELENLYLRGELYGKSGDSELIGNSSPMLQVFELIHRVAKGESTILIRGESGTGKELIARTIHQQSSRTNRPFVAVHCQSVPADLLELDLFGRARSVRTGPPGPLTGKFELASGGTIFLDEIGDIPPRLQAKILRTIDEKTIEPIGVNRSKKVDVRIVAATKADLEEKIRKGDMLSDFYFRLNVVPIMLPPLRERIEDVPLLVEHFLKKKIRGRSNFSFAAEDIESMMRYYWPGNVRELENVVERAIVLGTTDVNKLLPSLQPTSGPSTQMGYHRNELLNLSYKDAKKYILEEFEQFYFSNMLRKTNGNISRVAEIAQIHRKNLHVKISELGIDPKQYTQPESSSEEAPPFSNVSS